MKEAVVLIIDANESMATKVGVPEEKKSPKNDEGRSRFECAKEACIAILCDLMVRSKTNEATVVILHSETTNNYFYDHEDDKGGSKTDDDVEVHCPFPGITELSGNGLVMGIRQPLPDLLRTIQKLKPTSSEASRSKRKKCYWLCRLVRVASNLRTTDRCVRSPHQMTPNP